MPNFHTHWLVALQAIDGLPEEYKYLRDGRKNYVTAGVELGKNVRRHVADILQKLDLDGSAALQKTIEKKVTAWEDKLRADHEAICFSAFMLGACGPDFWVLPVDTGGGMVPDTAGHHFDLGHYNRSHVQFEVSLKALGDQDDLQARVEKSYFLGMATHIGADLVLHELVNVSAGAYNLLKMDLIPPNGTWSNEQACEWLSPDSAGPQQKTPEGGWLKRGWGHVANATMRGVHHVGENTGKTLGDTLPIWSTHNKVEHYWDTWVRYRWLGDFRKRVWPGDVDLVPAFTPLGLPLCDTIRLDLLGLVGPVSGMGTTIGHYATDVSRRIGRLLPGDDTDNKRATVVDRVNYTLGSVETRWLLEKPLAFPWLFSDEVLRGTCGPFIYDRVVDKTAGAYPAELVFKKAKEEAESGQMDDPAVEKPEAPDAGGAPAPTGGGRSEKKKLQFFSTERNHAIPASSWNYLNYLSCPALDRLQRYGDDRFYDREAFPPFVAAGAAAARTFANDLATAYGSDRTRLSKLGRFWNLDTGLGLRVENVESPERHQVITRIDWIHVLGPVGIAQPVDYTRVGKPAYAEKMKPAREPYKLAGWKDDERAFTVYRGKKFPKLAAVVEDDSVVRARKYLDRIQVDDAVKAVPAAPIFDRLAKQDPEAPDKDFEEALFVDDGQAALVRKSPVPTGQAASAELDEVSHRLDLVIRASIARLGAGPGDVAMFLLGDKGTDPPPPPSDDNAGPPLADDEVLPIDDFSPPQADIQPPSDDDAEDESAVGWLRKRSKILDRVIEPEGSPASDHSRLATFNARIIVNLAKDKTKADARVVAPKDEKTWNDVVPWEVHKGHYGRNFAVATARRYTLRGKKRLAPYNFDPTSNFKCLEGLGLTEHCFFTIYPLVKLADGTWMDAFSKEPVTKDAFKEMKKLTAINFVKIVLMYVIDGGGALQLRWCYLDGVRQDVTLVTQ
jgi:hypothetical protein